MGYLIGRELEAFEVVANDRQHPEVVAYEGKHLRLDPATPTAAWVAGHFDYAVGYERERYATTRPVGWSNRTELDPLHHPTEPASSRKDVVTLNLSGIDPFDAPARHFESFHAYPSWPNFVHEDPGYRATRDADGVNPYFGYLQELCAYYDGVPALITEFGVPSSWGRAKFSYGGFHHGGLSEAEQAALGARMARNIFDAGCGSAIYFHWMDGWFKRNWIVANRAFPGDRLPYWHDLTNPEQSYGMLAFDPVAPALTPLASSPVGRRCARCRRPPTWPTCTWSCSCRARRSPGPRCGSAWTPTPTTWASPGSATARVRRDGSSWRWSFGWVRARTPRSCTSRAPTTCTATPAARCARARSCARRPPTAAFGTRCSGTPAQPTPATMASTSFPPRTTTSGRCAAARAAPDQPGRRGARRRTRAPAAAVDLAAGLGPDPNAGRARRSRDPEARRTSDRGHCAELVIAGDSGATARFSWGPWSGTPATIERLKPTAKAVADAMAGLPSYP